jgi:hypothetical protein
MAEVDFPQKERERERERESIPWIHISTWLWVGDLGYPPSSRDLTN